MQLKERIYGAIMGLVIGDALGVPYEFKDSREIPKIDKLSFQPPKGVQSTYHDVPAGTWSDDSAQALCLLESLIKNEEFNLLSFSQLLLSWLREGYWAVNGEVFDCGIQTYHALEWFEAGHRPEICGFVHPDGKGNGALMRVLPIAIWYLDNQEKMIRTAHQQCLITHGHICNQVCCALYCLWVQAILLETEIKEAYYQAVEALILYYKNHQMDDYLLELEFLLQDGNFNGGGYVVDSFRSVKHLLFTNENYREVIKGAIYMGNDTDTTAAIAGGLAGAYYGLSAIPTDLVKELREADSVIAIVDKLLAKKAIV